VKLDEYIEGLFSNSGAILAKSLQSWRAGIDYEVGFWSRWFETRGMEWPNEYKVRTSPQPLAPWLAALLPKDQSRVAHVLDVGAGPITKSGSFVEGREIVFVATDPLARHYNDIVDRYGVTPPVRTQLSFAEDLSARFDGGQFDLISCTNALDHAIEPVWGIIEMLQVAAPNGVIVLGHRRNEAEYENYSGFHQWNFEDENGRFIIWNRDRRVDVTDLMNGIATLSTRIQNEYISVTIRKNRELPIDPLHFNRSLRTGVLESLLFMNLTFMMPRDCQELCVAAIGRRAGSGRFPSP